MENNKAQFSSKLGCFLAAAGSAVGVGNIWRFSTQCGENGGSGFIIAYLILILIFGLPLLICEMAIGKTTRVNVGKAYEKLAPNSLWKYIGWASAIIAFIIVCYYAVVVGWVLYYTLLSGSQAFTTTSIETTQDGYYANQFLDFIANPYKSLGIFALTLGITHVVIYKGVKEGIERISRHLVPTLFIIMLLLVVFATTMDGASKGYEFLFKFDANSLLQPKTWLAALGQCFYSLSIGMGFITYASYFGDNVNVKTTAFSIAGFDTLVAILAGIIIFPAVFSIPGLEPSSGASLVFISLPSVFSSVLANVPILNWLVPFAFFFILFIAAITSCIFLHEVATAFVKEHLDCSRRKSATIVTCSAFVIGSFAALSFGVFDYKIFFDMVFFDFLDYFATNLVLPMIALSTALFVGYKLDKNFLKTALKSKGKYLSYTSMIYYLMKFVIPLLTIVIFVNQFIDLDKWLKNFL